MITITSGTNTPDQKIMLCDVLHDGSTKFSTIELPLVDSTENDIYNDMSDLIGDAVSFSIMVV